MPARNRDGCRGWILIGACIILMLFGLGSLALGIVTVTQPEPTVAQCGSDVMQPSQQCEHTDTINGIPASKQVYNYDQQLADTKREHDLWPFEIGVGLLMFPGGVWCFLMRHRILRLREGKGW